MAQPPEYEGTTHAWSPPSQPPPPRRSNRQSDYAAIMLWITGGLQGLVFMCCSVLIFVGQHQLSDQQLQNQMLQDISARGGSEAEMQAIRDMLPVLATVLGVIPALISLFGAALVALGFGVRRNHPTASMAALIVLAIEAVGLGGLSLIYVLGSLLMGDLMAVAGGLVIGGGLVVLLVMTFLRVLKARRDPGLGGQRVALAEPDPEPWNAHLR